MTEGRCVFNPCEYRRAVFLCGGWTRAIEVFNPETCDFKLLSAQISEDDSPTLAVIENGQLLVMSETLVTRWEIEASHNLVFFSQEAKVLNCRVASNMPVQVDSINYVVYVVFNNECYGIKLDASWVEETWDYDQEEDGMSDDEGNEDQDSEESEVF